MGMSRSRNIAAIALAITLGAVGCTSDDPDASAPNTTIGSENLSSENILLTSGLQTVGDCDALLTRLVDEGLERVGPYGFGQGNYWFRGGGVLLQGEDAMEESIDFAQADDASAPAADERASNGDEGGGISGTNTQETDVDEADIVKTDGDRMVIVGNGKVQILDISDGAAKLVHSIKIAEYGGGGELFLNGDTALLMSTTWVEQAFPLAGDLARSSIRPAGTEVTRITTIDLANGTTGRAVEFEGNYLAAREVDGSVRIVIRAGMGNFGWLFPSNPDTEDAATEANKALLRQSTIGDWLPAYRVLEGGESVDAGLLFDCDRTHLPMDFSGFGTIGVLTVDANDDFALTDSLGVVTDGQTVYASTERLTVATPQYPEWDPQTGEAVDGDKITTALHTFDITDSSRTEYVASGEVEGTMLNQYSMSEHDGYLRVAVTGQVGTEWNDTASSIIVLTEQDGALVPTGRVDGLGEGEQIFAVRYQGDLAYVVTFRQIDPLYAIDLSDPNAPVTRGELKIPGFSNYLHPVGDGLLLGIGQDATDDGRTTGAQVSLFDVSDLENPTRIDTLALGSESSNSPVQWDARAFTWFDGTGIIPVDSWNWNEDGDGNSASAQMVRVEDNTLVDAGRVSHASVRDCEIYEEEYLVEEGFETEDAEAEFAESTQPAEEYCWSHSPSIIRTVVANGTLYTISYEGLQSWDFDTLAPGPWLSFN